MPTLSHRCSNIDNLKPTFCQPKPNNIREPNVIKLGTNQMPTLSHRFSNIDNLKPTSCQPKPNNIRGHNVIKLGTNQITTLAHRCKIITYQKPTKIPTLNQYNLLLTLQSRIKGLTR